MQVFSIALFIGIVAAATITIISVIATAVVVLVFLADIGGGVLKPFTCESGCGT
jgi:hypothetical protein